MYFINFAMNVDPNTNIQSVIQVPQNYKILVFQEARRWCEFVTLARSVSLFRQDAGLCLLLASSVNYISCWSQCH